MPTEDALSAVRLFSLNIRQVFFASKNGDDYNGMQRMSVMRREGKEFVPLTKRKRLARGSLWYFDEMCAHFVHTQTHRCTRTCLL